MSETEEDEGDAVSLDDANLSQTKNWTIKNVTIGLRLRAHTCAKKAGEPMHQTLERAITLLEAQQAGNRVLPPGPTRTNIATFEGQPVMVGANGHLSELAALVDMAVRLSPDGKRTQAMSVARAEVVRRLQALGGD